MEEMPENKSVNEPGKNILLEEVEFGFGGLILGLLAFLLLLFTLNYFNILSLSTIFPNQLGILPHRPFEQTSNQQKPSITPAPKLILFCPVPKEFCSEGKILGEKEEGNPGLGFNLPSETLLLAAFAGEVTDEPRIPNRLPNMPFLYLRNAQGNEVIYSYYGTVSVSLGSQVSAGTEIGKIGLGSFPALAPAAGQNFFFALKKDGQFQKISPQDFSK